MKCFVLASGSEGNCTYIETKKHKILIDAGRNNKFICEKLAQLKVDAKDIDYILLSHTHKDHVEALNVFLKKNTPTVCLGEKMIIDLKEFKYYPNLLFYENEIILDDIKITLIKTSHDTTDSRGFILEDEENSVVQITDTGYLNVKYLDLLRNRNYYIFESNHDVEMILNGPYPDFLKARIVGPKGHLSNKESAIYLSKMVGNDTKKIVLAHLSRHNNTEAIALSTIKEIFNEYNINFNNITCAKPEEIVVVSK